MSSTPRAGTSLGSGLEIERVFFSFDGPKLFVARNSTGQRFLAVAVDDTETAVVFIYVPVSNERLVAIKSGLISLREAITTPEGELFLATTGENATPIVKAIDPTTVADNWLPEPHARLSVSTSTQPAFEAAGLGKRAASETRSLFALELDRPDMLRTEYPVPDLRDFLEDIQEVVHAIAAEAEDKATSAGHIPDYILRDSELSLVELQAASFVMVLAPTLGDRMVEMPLATASAGRLISLLEAAGDEDVFRAEMSTMRKRAFAKVRDLFEDLVDTNVSIHAYLALPDGTLRHAGLDRVDAGRGLRILTDVSQTKTEVLIERSTLIGANIRTRAFELRDEATGEKYAGKVEPAALRQLDGLQLGAGYVYRARILREESFGSASSDVKITHRLQMIRRAIDAK
ncbi:MAG: DUF6575 domain-containing protein [Solirubrobacteraceae bacterium]